MLLKYQRIAQHTHSCGGCIHKTGIVHFHSVYNSIQCFCIASLFLCGVNPNYSGFSMQSTFMVDHELCQCKMGFNLSVDTIFNTVLNEMMGRIKQKKYHQLDNASAHIHTTQKHSHYTRVDFNMKCQALTCAFYRARHFSLNAIAD